MKLYGGRSHNGKRSLAALIALVLIICVAVGGTIAYIVTQTDAVKNIFNPADVTIDIYENFDGQIKKNVAVENTGTTDAYIRVKLVTYMVDESGNPTAGTATIPEFTPGEDWFYDNNSDAYYFRNPVAPSVRTSALIGEAGITLANGQVVEVLAEGIQATPIDAVKAAWGDAIASQLENKGA